MSVPALRRRAVSIIELICYIFFQIGRESFHTASCIRLLSSPPTTTQKIIKKIAALNKLAAHCSNSTQISQKNWNKSCQYASPLVSTWPCIRTRPIECRPRTHSRPHMSHRLCCPATTHGITTICGQSSAKWFWVYSNFAGTWYPQNGSKWIKMDGESTHVYRLFVSPQAHTSAIIRAHDM